MAEWRPSLTVFAAELEPNLAMQRAVSGLLTVPIMYHVARPVMVSTSMPGVVKTGRTSSVIRRKLIPLVA